jgi:catechol 2,3-dioxygenase-like lactoylglutathione lyase family enzyme
MAKLRHIAMVVEDIEKSATFYEKTFGMQRVRQTETAIAMSDGTVSLVVIHPSNANMKGETLRGLHHIGFLIDDMKAVTEKAESNGAKFVGGILGTGSGLETERKYVDPNGVNFDITMPEYARDFWKIAVDGA